MYLILLIILCQCYDLFMNMHSVMVVVFILTDRAIMTATDIFAFWSCRCIVKVDVNEIGVTLGRTWFVSCRFIGSRRDVRIDGALFTLAAAFTPSSRD